MYAAGNPDRFGAFATPATQDPDAAAAELDRAVTDLGFAGALMNGRGRYLDEPANEGLFERAETLGVPIYLRPTTPHPAVPIPFGLEQLSNHYWRSHG
jgi:2,3-dihydroxybenzoate decarboxylase